MHFLTLPPIRFKEILATKTQPMHFLEIVDNAAEESARNITIMVKEQRNPKKIVSIGVLDDGTSMTPEILQKAVCLNNGTRFYWHI